MLLTAEIEKKNTIKYVHELAKSANYLSYPQHNWYIAHEFVNGSPWHTIHRPSNSNCTRPCIRTGTLTTFTRIYFLISGCDTRDRHLRCVYRNAFNMQFHSFAGNQFKFNRQYIFHAVSQSLFQHVIEWVNMRSAQRHQKLRLWEWEIVVMSAGRYKNIVYFHQILHWNDSLPHFALVLYRKTHFESWLGPDLPSFFCTSFSECVQAMLQTVLLRLNEGNTCCGRFDVSLFSRSPFVIVFVCERSPTGSVTWRYVAERERETRENVYVYVETKMCDMSRCVLHWPYSKTVGNMCALFVYFSPAEQHIPVT